MAMSDILKAVIESLRPQIESANALGDKIAAATTDKGKLVHDLRESSDDPQVVKFREYKEGILASLNDAESKIDAYIRDNLVTSGENVDVEALRTQYKDAKDAAAAGLKYVRTMPGFSEDLLSDLPDLKNLRGGKSGGSGGKRPRVNMIYIDGEPASVERKNEKDQTVTTVSNFTVAAQALSKKSGVKVEVKDLQAAAFSAAGTDDLSSLDGKVFDFVFSAGDKNYTVKVETNTKSEDGATDSE